MLTANITLKLVTKSEDGTAIYTERTIGMSTEIHQDDFKDFIGIFNNMTTGCLKKLMTDTFDAHRADIQSRYPVTAMTVTAKQADDVKAQASPVEVKHAQDTQQNP